MYGKIDACHSVENNEYVFVRQILEAEVDTNLKKQKYLFMQMFERNKTRVLTNLET